MESRRQKKIARLVQKEVSDIFQKDGPAIYGSAFVTVTNAYVTPDLLVARIYLSVMGKGKEDALAQIEQHKNEVRHKLGNQLRHQLRKIPDLEFFLDESLDHVFKIEGIFKELDEEKKQDDAGQDKERGTDEKD